MRTCRQGRVATVQRWFRWLDERGAIEQHLMAAALASLLAALAGRAAEAERWADAADRRQHADTARPADAPPRCGPPCSGPCCAGAGSSRCGPTPTRPCASAWQRDIAAPVATVLQGIARVISGDLDDGDTFFQDAVSVREKAEGPEDVAAALCERSLVAMARDEWTQAEALAGQARTVVRRAGIEESFVTPLVCAVRARAALHRGDIPAARQELVSAQRMWHLDLPQARRLVAESGRHAGAGPRPPRPVTGRRSEGSSGRPDIT